MNDATSSQPYEAPRIEQRAPFDVPLIGVTSNIDTAVSAAFRSV